eukprot:2074940-Alexandrium_andersonii.AAC.1
MSALSPAASGAAAAPMSFRWRTRARSSTSVPGALLSTSRIWGEAVSPEAREFEESWPDSPSYLRSSLAKTPSPRRPCWVRPA